MHARERIIRERFAAQTCAECGAQHTPESVLILARRPTTWMVMVSCPACQQRTLFLVSFPDAHEPSAPAASQPLTSAPLLPDVASPPPPLSSPPLPHHSHHPHHSPQARASAPVTAHDVDEMHAFLASFTGDFQRLFAQSRSRQIDEPPAQA